MSLEEEVPGSLNKHRDYRRDIVVGVANCDGHRVSDNIHTQPSVVCISNLSRGDIQKHVEKSHVNTPLNIGPNVLVIRYASHVRLGKILESQIRCLA